MFEYLPELEVSNAYNPSNCAVIERTADGVSVGVCGFFLKDGVTCPRHGIVRRVSHGEDSTTVKTSKEEKLKVET